MKRFVVYWFALMETERPDDRLSKMGRKFVRQGVTGQQLRMNKDCLIVVILGGLIIHVLVVED